MEDLAIGEPGDGAQAEMRMRPDVETVRLGDLGGSHMVGEAPRTDRSPAPSGQCPAHRDVADLRPMTFGDLEPDAHVSRKSSMSTERVHDQ